MEKAHKRTQTTLAEYTVAVAALITVAQQPTSGGSIAAQILLSAYNGFDYQANIGALRNLDSENFELAAAVFTGRYDTGVEPHTVIKSGSRVFEALRQQWRCLHVEERGKKECPVCYGRGLVYLSPNDDDDRSKECLHCEGTGRVCSCGCHRTQRSY